MIFIDIWSDDKPWNFGSTIHIFRQTHTKQTKTRAPFSAWTPKNQPPNALKNMMMMVKHGETTMKSNRFS